MSEKTLEFSIGGMHCAACSSRIERVVGALPEVASVSVSLADNSARLALSAPLPREEAAALIVETVANLGFSARLVEAASGGVSESALRWEERRAAQGEELARRRRELIPAFAFALPLLVLSMGEMLGMPLPALISPARSPLGFALAQLALCLPVLWSGRRFFMLGLPALRRGTPTMDSLVALGTGAAFLFSLWNTVLLALPPGAGHGLPPGGAHALAEAAGGGAAGGGSAGVWDMFFGAGHAMHGVELYFESAAVVIALVSLGKYLEARSRLHTSEAMKGLLDLAPETALRVTSSPPLSSPAEEIPLAAVRVGDVLLIRPGGRIPVDGVVLEGASAVDESMLTGESMPVEKGPGDPLAGGSMNRQGVLAMRAERVGADTVLARIVRLVQEAQGSKAPIAGMADRVSLYFVPAVMAMAFAAGLFWWVHGGSGAFALRIFVSVMVIACPCAMGLATPMSIMVATGRGAQLGALFKNGQALEQSSRINAMVFDKTGTLTLGRPSLAAVLPLGGIPGSQGGKRAAASSPASSGPGHGAPLDVSGEERENFLLRIAASLESSSEHPLARALVRGAQERGLAPMPVENFLAVPGRGVSGTVLMENGPVPAAVGNTAFAREHAGTDGGLEGMLAARAALGQTPVILLLEGAPAAVFAIADPVREEAAGVVRRLAGMGIESVMLTGDNRLTAESVARTAGISRVIAEVLPEGKERAVASLQGRGRVVGMVGDGVNDAPALARADVGFAMSGGIDVAVETGDVALMRQGLGTVVTALELGRATMRNIRENLFWAFAYNVVGIPFAAGVFYFFGGPALSPMLAGAAMALSSVSVVSNALRLRFFKAAG